jgi:hypothetical protein
MKSVAFLGDDVAHKNNNKAYQNYIALMNAAGVKFNNLKSQISYDPSLKVAEFCKRIMINGVNVTPVSPIVMYTIGKDGMYLPLVCDEDISIILGCISMVLRNIDSSYTGPDRKEINKSV